MTFSIDENRQPQTEKHFTFSAAEVQRHAPPNAGSGAGPDVPAFFDQEAFLERVASRLRSRKKRGTLAYFEIQSPFIAGDHSKEDVNSSIEIMYGMFSAHISETIGPEDIFSCYDGRFVLLLADAGTARQTLRQLSRRIAKSSCSILGVQVHVTPAVGYVDLQMAASADDLAQMSETALDCAKSSLEIEPFRYVRRLGARYRPSSLTKSLGLWSRAPQWLALSIQLLLSLVLGLGAPFILYAVCDAVGVDISGPVYIGVVAVLVITAATIWIEGLLALKSTTPPLQPGSAFPPATVIIPAYLPNEADTIVDTVNAFLRLDYPNILQIIIAYNSPRYLAVEADLQAIAALHTDGGRFVIEPVRVVGSTSKAQNVNAVIGKVRGSFVGIFDADHHPRPDSIRRAWRWLSNGWDIVQGRCSIRNGAESWVSRMVAIEFEQIYAVNHPGRARFHGFGIFGGSNGFWRTSVLHETRMRHSMLTEDIDSSIRAVGAGYKIAGDRDLVSEELAPTSLDQLLNQRLRWAQGWFQVSLQRVIPTLCSPRVSFRQKLGLIHLLIWRELFPWYSIQVVPIMTYWVWAYGWHYIHWAVPIFVATTIFTFSTGPLQIFLAYFLAEKPTKRKAFWFLEYLFVSTFFFSPFKDTLSRIAHIKEAMRERAWRVTPRSSSIPPPTIRTGQLAKAAAVVLVIFVLTIGSGMAETVRKTGNADFPRQYWETLLGGEVTTINAARRAAMNGRNSEAATLFEKAITAVPSRRHGLLREYADALSNSGRGKQGASIYRELLASPSIDIDEEIELTKRLALALTWSRQFPAAMRIYDDLLAQTPGNAEIEIQRAGVLIDMEQADAAIAALDQVVSEKWSKGPLQEKGEEILVKAARNAARHDQNKTSAALFERALRHNVRLRPSLLREYADQLVFARRAEEALPLYYEVINSHFGSARDMTEAHLGLALALLQSGKPKDASKLYTAVISHEKPGTILYKRSKRGLSLALTWSNQPLQALDSWNLYLSTDPNDVDALLHKAQVLSSLHRNEQALETYKVAYASDRKNVSAKSGIVNETINLARQAARDDRNAQSSALFQSVFDLDPVKRKYLLREYADQLSFDGRPAEAVPLYREVLGNGALSEIDRERSMRGLADALAWSDHSNEALAAYLEMARSYPNDENLQWTYLVFAARKAAQENRNKESTNLFARAIAIDAVSSSGILREYADQLSFSDRSAEAIPIYRAFLSRPALTSEDRRDAQQGLAQALDWTGDQTGAKAVYRQLMVEYPQDVSLRWNLLVASAHEAAQADSNEKAVGFFADAIALLPGQRSKVLKEYADQLSYTGQVSKAVSLYREILNRPVLSEADRVSGLKGLAQAYDWSDRPDQAKLIYYDLLRSYANDRYLQWGVLVFSAHQASKEDRNKEAATFLEEAMQIVPSRRPIILKEYADKLVFTGRAREAIPLYRELVEKGGPAPTVRSAKLALALALAWDRQTGASIDQYRHLVSADSDDLEAKNGLAQILSWNNREAEAKEVYEQVLAVKPHNPDALRGLALVEDWQGHHQAAQAVLAQRLTDDPSDLQARRLLAQSLFWMGRPDKAMSEVNKAMGQLQASNASVRRISSASGANPGIETAQDGRHIRPLLRAVTLSSGDH